MTLPDHCHRRVPIRQAEDLVTARGIAVEQMGAGFAASQRDRVGVIISELGSNLLRHAPDGGVILIRSLDQRSGMECICHDRGPGIADVDAILRDGGSNQTGRGQGGLGIGLRAVRRLADEFEIHSEPLIGTAVLARVRGVRAEQPSWYQSGAVMLPMAGQTACGDGWIITQGGLVAVIDGLGHGPEASTAARRAEASAGVGHDDPRRTIDAMHEALRGTRGAVVMVVLLGGDDLRYAGVGNVTATVIGTDSSAPLHSSWGVIGGNARPAAINRIPWRPGDVLLLATDGVSQASRAFAARHLRYVDPALACAIVLRDAVSKLDDQTVVIVRRQKGPAVPPGK